MSATRIPDPSPASAVKPAQDRAAGFVIVTRSLPGFAIRPDLAMALKRPLREHKLEALTIEEVKR